MTMIHKTYCCWVFVVKFNPDTSVARLKASLVAKSYA